LTTSIAKEQGVVETEQAASAAHPLAGSSPTSCGVIAASGISDFTVVTPCRSIQYPKPRQNSRPGGFDMAVAAIRHILALFEVSVWICAKSSECLFWVGLQNPFAKQKQSLQRDFRANLPGFQGQCRTRAKARISRRALFLSDQRCKTMRQKSPGF
jgi:hypothetical protein